MGDVQWNAQSSPSRVINIDQWLAEITSSDHTDVKSNVFANQARNPGGYHWNY